MPSPFPGMDPYLEPHWLDVHTSLVTYMRDALQELLPSSLRARAEERVVLEQSEGWGSPIFPDVRVVERQPRPLARDDRSAPVAIEPMLIAVEHEMPTERFIEIVDSSSGHRVVTVIEFLSPTNKTPGPGMETYRRKQRKVLESQSNLVEIDLVRAGRHVLAVPLDNIPSAKRTPYMVCVRRTARRDVAEVYSIPLTTALPRINVPLRESDADVQIDLQAILDKCYKMGGYDGDLNYALPPDPPLVGHEAEWADQLLKEKGLRPRSS